MTKPLTCAAHRFVLLCCCMLAALDSHAMTFKEDQKAGAIYASGPVELEDAERLEKLLTLEFRQGHQNVRQVVTVSINSPGGSLLGGIRLGYLLRKLHTHTEVEEGAMCMSACAIAFLGGDVRTVSGQYGVHAVRFAADKNTLSAADQVDTVQKLGAVIIAYSKEMTGTSDAMERGLSTSASNISVLTDTELVSMKVITLARRASQHGRPGFKCPTQIETTVLGAVCSHLDISQLDNQLNDLFKKIQGVHRSEVLDQDQARWRRYRNSCINDGSPNGFASVVFCVRESYLVRRDQLLSIWLEISAKKTRPGAANWAEVKP